ncbi:hypothetical protein phiOC_p404 [Ochrobactrum phage vB_OspM_OC]|nr:hypothetical protein phiOC_p404 [Ochrobactrum phage vB_OspM_OC]
MALWSKTDKPKWLTEDQKEKVIATERGWVYQHDNGTNEVLVCISDLDTTPPVEPEPDPETP